MKKLGMLCLIAALGCNTEQFTDVPSESNFYFIRLSPEAASIAVGQTQQVSVTAYDAGPCSAAACSPFAPGNPVTVEGLPTFRSTDTTRVRVSSTGLVSGIAAGTASVIARLQNIPGTTNSISVSRVDTTVFTVTATPVSLGTIQLAGRAVGTANTIGAGSTLALVTTITNSGNAAVTNVGRAQYYSGNTTVATVSTTGTVTGVQPGNATIFATITVGGVTRTTTFDVRVTQPVSATVAISPAVSGTGVIFFPGSLTVSATQAKVEGRLGAIVAFTVSSTAFSATTTPNNTQCFNVTFATPAAAGAVAPSTSSGNIGVGPAEAPLCTGTRSRLFTSPGTYTFTSTTNAASGTIVVE